MWRSYTKQVKIKIKNIDGVRNFWCKQDSEKQQTSGIKHGTQISMHFAIIWYAIASFYHLSPSISDTYLSLPFPKQS